MCLIIIIWILIFYLFLYMYSGSLLMWLVEWMKTKLFSPLQRRTRKRECCNEGGAKKGEETKIEEKRLGEKKYFYHTEWDLKNFRLLMILLDPRFVMIYDHKTFARWSWLFKKVRFFFLTSCLRKLYKYKLKWKYFFLF